MIEEAPRYIETILKSQPVAQTKTKRVAFLGPDAAFSIEIFGGIDDAFDEDLHRVKPHPGQIAISDTIKKLYAGTKNITIRKNMHDKIRNQNTSSRLQKPV